jgi:prepilin-type processing-associated H-X9-DG protein
MIHGPLRPPSIRSNPAAFSFIEILVTMTLITILAAFFFPAANKARERGRQVKCLNSMRQIGLAFRCYQNDHKGYYPRVNDSATENWESYLGDPTVGGVYLSGSLMGTDPWGNTKFKTTFLCPTMVRRPEFAAFGEYWGYSINYCRVGISYNAANWPWQLAQIPDLDLDTLYQPSLSAVLVDGNFIQFGGNDWDAFSSGAWFDWAVIPIHDSSVNVLFLDGHVASMNVTSQTDRDRFNTVWHHGVPTTLGNPW